MTEPSEYIILTVVPYAAAENRVFILKSSVAFIAIRHPRRAA